MKSGKEFRKRSDEEFSTKNSVWIKKKIDVMIQFPQEALFFYFVVEKKRVDFSWKGKFKTKESKFKIK